MHIKEKHLLKFIESFSDGDSCYNVIYYTGVRPTQEFKDIIDKHKKKYLVWYNDYDKVYKSKTITYIRVSFNTTENDLTVLLYNMSRNLQQFVIKDFFENVKEVKQNRMKHWLDLELNKIIKDLEND